MKTCPTCGYDSPDDSEFCMRCGAYFPDSRGQPSEPAAVPQVEQKPTEDAERAMEQGFQEMTGEDFAGAVARWSEAIKAGMEVDDATYERMLSECVGAIMRSVSKQGVQSRTGVGDLAVLLDDRDLVTDILSGLDSRAEHLGFQRELMNTANEYMFLSIESFSVYTDLNDLIAICDEAIRVFTGMADRVESLEPVESKYDPKTFLLNYIQFFQVLRDRLQVAIDRTPASELEFLSDYWADKSGARFSDMIMGASNMNAQLIAAGWLGNKLATKTRDMQIDAFLTTYLAPAKQKSS